jgi:hypothetical protein
MRPSAIGGQADVQFLTAAGPALTLQHTSIADDGSNHADYSGNLVLLLSGHTEGSPTINPAIAVTAGFLNNVINVGGYHYVAHILDEAGLSGWPWTLNVQDPCRKATDANITLSGIQLGSNTGDRFLVKNQTNASENGIYDANNAGAWTRSQSASSDSQFTLGMLVPVLEGSTNGSQIFQLQTNGVKLGTTGISFQSFTSNPNATGTMSSSRRMCWRIGNGRKWREKR